ncbi:MAG: methyltransferase domain-containing protein [Proteobacteria bacterium]|nr:methyltransferase domain-containing protein [Pseudomonadota bacterium]
MFDRKLYAARRQRFSEEAGKVNFLHLEVEDGLIETLSHISKRFEKVWLYGQFYKFDPYDYGAIAVEKYDILPMTANSDIVSCLDEEELAMPIRPTYDLVISHMSAHLINDLPGLLLKYRRMLNPGGLFIATLYGEHTLHELRQAMMQVDMELLGGAAPRVIPFVDVRTAGSLLQRAGFAMPVASYDRYQSLYRDIWEMFFDIRANAQANCLYARTSAPLNRLYLQRLEEVYKSKFALQEGIVCTYDVLTLSGSVDTKER